MKFIMKKCSICGKQYKGMGNNAQPINKGRCCEQCNSTVVIPRQMADFIIKEGGKSNG